jgi:hypothetical protein
MISIRGRKKGEFFGKLVMLLVGAVIGVSSSLVTVVVQQKYQYDQFILDKKIQALRDFTMEFNKNTVRWSMTLDSLENNYLYLEGITSDGELPIASDFDGLNKDYSEFKSIQQDMGGLLGQKILLYALFDTKAPDVSMGAPSMIDEALNDKMIKETNPKIQAAMFAKAYHELRDLVTKQKLVLVSITNATNDDLTKLAKSIQR